MIEWPQTAAPSNYNNKCRKHEIGLKLSSFSFTNLNQFAFFFFARFRPKKNFQELIRSKIPVCLFLPFKPQNNVSKGTTEL